MHKPQKHAKKLTLYILQIQNIVHIGDTFIVNNFRQNAIKE